MLMLICAFAIFGLVALIHELGHFIAAKFLGVRVITFSLGFGPRLWSKRIGQTIYCLSVLPFGAYVRPYAMKHSEPAHSASDRSERRSFLTPLEELERALLDEIPYSDSGNLLRTSALSRLTFLISGAALNLLSVWLIAFLYFSIAPYSRASDVPRVGSVLKGSSAELAGLREGDLIVHAGDVAITNWRTLANEILSHGDKDRSLSIERKEDEDSQSLTVVLHRRSATRSQSESGGPLYAIGIVPTIVFERRSVHAAAWIASDIYCTVVAEVYGEFKNTILGKRGGGELGTRENEPDPGLGVVSNFLDTGFQASKSLTHFFSFFCALSVIAAFFNLLPLPALDGGQIALLMLQSIFRVPISLELEQRLNRSGLVLVELLLLICLGADLVRSAKILF
jgi:regulator of sigma E protease